MAALAGVPVACATRHMLGSPSVEASVEVRTLSLQKASTMCQGLRAQLVQFNRENSCWRVPRIRVTKGINLIKIFQTEKKTTTLKSSLVTNQIT